MSTKRLYLVLTLLLGGGCTLPVDQAIDRNICSKLNLSVDLAPKQADMAPAKMTSATGPDATLPSVLGETGIQLLGAQGKEKTYKSLPERVKVPPEVPGSNAAPIKRLPPDATPEQRKAEVDRQFPPLEDLGKVLQAAPGPTGRPLTLADLQKLAIGNSPILKAMTADVEAARGNALQARLYPNPFIGLTGQSMATNGGPYFGGIIQQPIKTAGKLTLAYAAAYKDVEAADLQLRAAEADLRSKVRAGYFGVLVARQNVIVNHALAKLTDDVFTVLKGLLKAGDASYFETFQLRSMANQMRMAYIQAHYTYSQAWNQLANTMGMPGMPLTQLEGRLDMPLPNYEYDKVLAIVLSRHTDVLVAKVGLEKAEKLLRLAQVTPVPDIQTALSVIPDYTPGFGIGPYRTFAVAQAGVTLPIFDRNQGGIRQAQGQLARAIEEPHRVRCDLSARLAGAFNRYEYNRKFVAMYHKDILQDQVQAFRAVVQRYNVLPPAGGVQFLDLITAEQSLVTLIQSYMAALHDMWFGAVDVAALLQTPDFFQVESTYPIGPMPDLEQLFDLPCLHPCNPLPDPQLYKGNGVWPKYGAAGGANKGAAAPLPQMQNTQIELGAPSLQPPQDSLPVGRVSQLVPVIPNRRLGISAVPIQ